MECTWGENRRPATRPARVHRALPPLVAALCVAVGVLLAAISEFGDDAAPAATVARAARAPAVAFVPDKAAPHRRQVFDERRARFDVARGATTRDEVATGR